jgi:DNA-binding NtrC family response regulator
MVGNHKAPPQILPLSDVAAEAEKDHIIKILKSTEGNRTKAAEILCISRKTLITMRFQEGYSLLSIPLF